MNRRKLLSAGPAATILAGTVAAGQGGASTPILDAGRQLGALDALYDAADVLHGNSDQTAGITDEMERLGQFVIAGTPTTPTEALIVLMVAAGCLGTAPGSATMNEEIQAAMLAAARASHCLAGAFGVTVADFGGNYFLPDLPAPFRTAGRAA